jgi:hypothetical protein
MAVNGAAVVAVSTGDDCDEHAAMPTMSAAKPPLEERILMNRSPLKMVSSGRSRVLTHQPAQNDTRACDATRECARDQ